VKVFYNKHYLAFYVVTKYDVRIYDATNGELNKTMSGLIDVDNGIEIIDF
jgi:hypothetical protein